MMSTLCIFPSFDDIVVGSDIFVTLCFTIIIGRLKPYTVFLTTIIFERMFKM